MRLTDEQRELAERYWPAARDFARSMGRGRWSDEMESVASLSCCQAVAMWDASRGGNLAAFINRKIAWCFLGLVRREGKIDRAREAEFPLGSLVDPRRTFDPVGFRELSGPASGNPEAALALYAHYVEGRGVDEIAEALEISRESAKRRLATGRRLIRAAVRRP